MIIWRGWGILVLLIAALFQWLGYAISSGLGYGPLEGDAQIIGYLLFLPAAVLLWFLGRYLNKPKVYTDKATGQQVYSKGGRHSLFYIPIEYWAFIYVLLAIILTIVQLVQ
jgi:hypothetical protein